MWAGCPKGSGARRSSLDVPLAKEGAVADKSTQFIVDALSRAFADPGGVPLHGNRKKPGLFAATAVARQLAQRCKDEGLLSVAQSEPGGKGATEICTITEKGLAYLLSQVSPKQVLEDLVRTLAERGTQVGELVSTARQWQTGVEALQTTVTRVLQQLEKAGAPAAVAVGPAPSGNGSKTWQDTLIAYLVQARASDTTQDTPLPELFRRASQAHAGLTIGQFHDGLRKLYEQEKLYLHPWTGPLYEIPEPAYALLTGHQIAYYASIR
jgi:hypothetical protein